MKIAIIDDERKEQDILIFDKGKVVQHGTHEKLLEQSGLYQQLWKAQAQYYTTQHCFFIGNPLY